MSAEEQPTTDTPDLLDNIESAVLSKDFEHALDLVRAAQPRVKDPKTSSAVLRRYLQLQALCRIFLAQKTGSNAAWWSVFGVSAASSEAFADLKRQFKRLAAIVHPDKCHAYKDLAGEAFTLLQQGLETLLESLQEPELQKKRPRKEKGSAAEADEQEEKFSTEEEEDDGKYAWWTEWDDRALNNGTSGNSNKNAPLDVQVNEEIVQDNENLAAMESDALRKEVRRRQDALLDALPPGKTLEDLRNALMRARAALSAKVEAEKLAEIAGGGGFL